MSLYAYLFYCMSQYALLTIPNLDPTLHYQQLLTNLYFSEPQDCDIAKHWCHIMQRQLYEFIISKSKYSNNNITTNNNNIEHCFSFHKIEINTEIEIKESEYSK